MRELSAETLTQLQKQLDKVTSVAPGRGLSAEARDAVLEATFLVAASDGQVTPLEAAQFAEAVETVLGGGADADARANKLADRLAREGWAARAKAVHHALAGSGHGELAFRLAVAVAFVDDEIAPAEAAALDGLAEALDLDAERAHAVMSEVRTELFGAR